jgi:uncharacterized protein with PIN domain/sulfur carrier protein ThiS
MSLVAFRFYAELNDFLRDAQKKTRFKIELNRRTSVKDLIESLGVPHTEVEIILANGKSVDFTYIVEANDDISVYPMFESVDITPILKLRDEPLRQTRFVLDCHLGRLARYLRQFGFDTLYRNDYSDDELAQTSADQNRILLTRDRSLLKRSIITHGYFVRAFDPREQLDEVIRRFDLKGQIVPFGRCTRCNGIVKQVEKQDIVDQLEPKTRRYYNTFWQCTSCDQIYWEGSHVKHMIRLTDEVLNSG